MTDPKVLTDLLKIDITKNDEVELVERHEKSVEFSIKEESEGVPPELMCRFADRNARLVVGSEFGNYSVFLDK